MRLLISIICMWLTAITIWTLMSMDRGSAGSETTSPPPEPYDESIPTQYFPLVEKGIHAWAEVKRIYPISTKLVADVRVAAIDGKHCFCQGAVWPQLPTVIWIDIAYNSWEPVAIEGVMAHELIHVRQFIDGRHYSEALEPEAYAEQLRYKIMRYQELAGTIKITPESAIVEKPQ